MDVSKKKKVFRSKMEGFATIVNGLPKLSISVVYMILATLLVFIF